MEIYPGIKIVDLALYLPLHKALIFGDVHIGYEETMTIKGVLVPKFQFDDLKKRILSILDTHTVETVVINGDLKHEFGKILRTEWKQTLEFIELLKSKVKTIILLEGNHDKILEPLARRKNLPLGEEYSFGDVYVCHGDFIPETEAFRKAKIIIIGHEHPAITLTHGRKSEKYKCFLKGSYQKKVLIVMPSYHVLTTGTNVLEAKILSPFLQRNLDNFEVYIVGDAPLYFGKLKNV